MPSLAFPERNVRKAQVRGSRPHHRHQTLCEVAKHTTCRTDRRAVESADAPAPQHTSSCHGVARSIGGVAPSATKRQRRGARPIG